MGVCTLSVLFYFAHYYIFWINTIFPGIRFYTLLVDDYLNYLGNEFRWGLVVFDEVQYKRKQQHFLQSIYWGIVLFKNMFSTIIRNMALLKEIQRQIYIIFLAKMQSTGMNITRNMVMM